MSNEHSERRSEPREHPSDVWWLQGALAKCGSDDYRIVDISPTGIQLSGDDNFAAGTSLTLELAALEGTRSVSARVVWSHRLRSPSFVWHLVGCRLSVPIADLR